MWNIFWVKVRKNNIQKLVVEHKIKREQMPEQRVLISRLMVSFNESRISVP
jgi:hypothetical protein